MSLRCHYHVLAVERTATDDELKKAWTRQLQRLLPRYVVGGRENLSSRAHEVNELVMRWR